VTQRRLCVFFRAAGIRYAIDAGSVLEVAQPGPHKTTLRGHMALKDFSQFLGGVGPLLKNAALVFDTSPTIAARIDEVDGIFDAAEATTLLSTTLTQEILSGPIKQGLLYQDALWFELELDGFRLGYPKFNRAIATVQTLKVEPCLFFTSENKSAAIPLVSVRQIVQRDNRFSAAAARDHFRGFLAFSGSLLPVFSLSSSNAPEPFLIIIETAEHRLAFTANAIHGVKSSAPDTLVVDLDGTFS